MIKKLFTISDENSEKIEAYSKKNGESQSRTLDDILTMFFNNTIIKREEKVEENIFADNLSRYKTFDEQVEYAMRILKVDPNYPKQYLNFTSQMITDVYDFLCENGVATTRDSVHRKMVALYVK